MSPGIELETSHAQGRAVANCATLAPYCQGNKLKFPTFQVL